MLTGSCKAVLAPLSTRPLPSSSPNTDQSLLHLEMIRRECCEWAVSCVGWYNGQATNATRVLRPRPNCCTLLEWSIQNPPTLGTGLCFQTLQWLTRVRRHHPCLDACLPLSTHPLSSLKAQSRHTEQETSPPLPTKVLP